MLKEPMQVHGPISAADTFAMKCGHVNTLEHGDGSELEV
jgi:hypothetical protein